MAGSQRSTRLFYKRRGPVPRFRRGAVRFGLCRLSGTTPGLVVTSVPPLVAPQVRDAVFHAAPEVERVPVLVGRRGDIALEVPVPTSVRPCPQGPQVPVL